MVGQSREGIPMRVPRGNVAGSAFLSLRSQSMDTTLILTSDLEGPTS